MNPDFPISYVSSCSDYIALNRLDEAKATYAQALERKLNNPLFYVGLYQIAFLAERCGGDGAADGTVRRACRDRRTNCWLWKPIPPPIPGGLRTPENFPVGRWIPLNGQEKRNRLQCTLPSSGSERSLVRQRRRSTTACHLGD